MAPLKFDSQFESGNLLWSRMIGHTTSSTGRQSRGKNIFKNIFKKEGSGGGGKYPVVQLQEYDLVLQHDLFTNGNVQWFYFRCGGTRRGLTVRFNLINMKKSGSLFGDGGKLFSFLFFFFTVFFTVLKLSL